MHALNLLAALAELDFLSRTPPGYHRFTLPQYSNVEIAFQAVSPRTDIEIRVLVFGAYYGIYQIMTQKKFKEAEFDLYWKKEHVAWLRFEKPSRPVPAYNETVTPESAPKSSLRLGSTGSMMRAMNGLSTNTTTTLGNE